MDIEAIRAWLKEHAKDAEVVKFVGEFAPALTAERVTEYLDSDEGFAAVRSRFDRYATKAITTHDEKKETEIKDRIEKAVAEAAKKSKLTGDEQVRAEMEELRKQITDRDAAIARKDMVGKIRGEATKRGVPVDLVVDFDNPSLTEAKAIERMEAYAKAHAAEVQAKVTERLGAGYKPGTGTGADNGKANTLPGIPPDVIAAMDDPSLSRFN